MSAVPVPINNSYLKATLPLCYNHDKFVLYHEICLLMTKTVMKSDKLTVCNLSWDQSSDWLPKFPSSALQISLHAFKLRNILKNHV